MQSDVDIVAMLRGFPPDRAQHSRKIPVAHIHDYDPDIVGASLHQASRQQIRPIVMLLRDTQNHFLCIRMNSSSPVKCAVYGRA